LAAELGEGNLDLQHRVKTVLDPDGILNPGKAV
jgi:FAD/FMN-containing dehydrogenase